MNFPFNCTAQSKFRKLQQSCLITVNCESIQRKYEDFDETELRTTKWSLSSTMNRHAQTPESCELKRVEELQYAYHVAKEEHKKTEQ